ncbi:hypothetical protein JCM33374_g3015 [Metschnikowia sp. JCM 33374]|nr:hypothetical protein JCM33374_g3015 [Metschnikowia sp. JCM 33374]
MQKSALSISSHVSHGYVGNRATVFSLQYYGWNVDAIHTTEFSNHPGYGQFKGKKTDSQMVKTLFDGLVNIMDMEKDYNLILVGYCPSAQVMSTIYQEITPLLSKGDNCRPILVVDPVLGDNGKLYVPQEIVEVHINFMTLGLVNLTTPNQFELELLTGIQMHSWATVKEALTVFNEKYKVPNVVLSSVIVDGEMFGVGFAQDNNPKIFSIPIKAIKCGFSGCGDVFTALITHAFYENSCTLNPEILGQVLAKLSRILKVSFDEEKAILGTDPTFVKDVRLIQSRKLLDETIDDDFEVKYL